MGFYASHTEELLSIYCISCVCVRENYTLASTFNIIHLDFIFHFSFTHIFEATPSIS